MLDGLARLRRGEVLLQCLVVEALQAAEEVDFPGGGKAHRVLVHQERLAGGLETPGVREGEGQNRRSRRSAETLRSR